MQYQSTLRSEDMNENNNAGINTNEEELDEFLKKMQIKKQK